MCIMDIVFDTFVVSKCTSISCSQLLARSALDLAAASAKRSRANALRYEGHRLRPKLSNVSPDAGLV